MSDAAIISGLERLVGAPFQHEFEGDRCVALDLTSPDFLYHGLVRHHSLDEKQAVLQCVCQLTSLRRLNLRRNRLFDLPAAFGDLRELEELNLGSNCLGKVPEPLRLLTKLRSLHLGNNGIAELPGFIGGLQQLESLALHKNIRLKGIENLCGLGGLKSLNLHFLNLNRIPRFIYSYTRLRNLTVWNVAEISDEIAGLRNLEFFSACGSPGLRRLPEGFTALKKLRMTRLFQNSIEALPARFGDLDQLEQISLYQNRLSSLPESFGNLGKLKKLNLGWNRFETVPGCLCRLRNLEWLALFENPLTQPDLATIVPGATVLARWPFTTLKERQPEAVS